MTLHVSIYKEMTVWILREQTDQNTLTGRRVAALVYQLALDGDSEASNWVLHWYRTSN